MTPRPAILGPIETPISNAIEAGFLLPVNIADSGPHRFDKPASRLASPSWPEPVRTFVFSLKETPNE